MFASILRHRGTELAARWILGAIFIAASYHKIVSPGDFAKIVFGYDLFPAATINMVAVVLPFVELVAGIALVTGVWVRSAAAITIGLLAAFIAVVSINIARGHVFECGCFSAGNPLSPANPWMTLLRNVALILLGYFILNFKNDEGRILSKD